MCELIAYEAEVLLRGSQSQPLRVKFSCGPERPLTLCELKLTQLHENPASLCLVKLSGRPVVLL